MPCSSLELLVIFGAIRRPGGDCFAYRDNAGEGREQDAEASQTQHILRVLIFFRYPVRTTP